jgi:beta-lactamase class A
MSVAAILAELSVTGAAYAAPVRGEGVGTNEDQLMTPASVMKIQVALAAESAIATGAVDGSQQRVLSPEARTAGTGGISLLRDEVRMSIRDLVPQMLTISDNVATDELISVVGLERINQLTAELGLTRTRITSDLRSTLDGMAMEAGFTDYAALARHDPTVAGPPSTDEIQERLERSAALDPTRGSRTTAADTVRLLQAIWTDTAATPTACAPVRWAMGQQLTRHRIASGFGPHVTIAAKSGGLMGIVRNEAGVVSFPDGQQYAIAVFTRRALGATTDPAHIDAGIGQIARTLIDDLRRGRPPGMKPSRVLPSPPPSALAVQAVVVCGAQSAV